MGEYLLEMEKNKGGNPNLTTGSPETPVEKPPTYSEIGVTKKEAAEAQVL
jgi:hypothetical protein